MIENVVFWLDQGLVLDKCAILDRNELRGCSSVEPGFLLSRGEDDQREREEQRDGKKMLHGTRNRREKRVRHSIDSRDGGITACPKCATPCAGRTHAAMALGQGLAFLNVGNSHRHEHLKRP